MDSTVGSKPNPRDFAHSPSNLTIPFMLGAGNCGLQRRVILTFTSSGISNGGLVRQNGGPFRVRPWHYERCRGCLLSRFVCRSTAIYSLILPLFLSTATRWLLTSDSVICALHRVLDHRAWGSCRCGTGQSTIRLLRLVSRKCLDSQLPFCNGPRSAASSQ